MTVRRDPIERLTDRLQDFVIAHAPIPVMVAVAIALLAAGVVFTLFTPLPGLAGRVLILGPIAVGSATLGLARWTRSERRYLTAHHDGK